MAEIIAAMASSHALALSRPDQWDARRSLTHHRYASKYGVEAPEQRQVEGETLEGNEERFRPLQDGYRAFQEAVVSLKPDVLVLMGDDQGENYTDFVPQFSIYTGDELVTEGRGQRVTCASGLARSLVGSCVREGFDVAFSRAFPEDELRSHAHAQILGLLQPSMPVVPIFFNAIYPPAPEPARCYAFGQALGRAIQAHAEPLRVVVYASGGLSHFSAGYPYESYEGPFGLGAISEDFDERFVDWVTTGHGEQTATLTARDLLDNGAIEFRQWIALLGILGDRKPDWLRYGAFYRGIMGMAVAYWGLEQGG